MRLLALVDSPDHVCCRYRIRAFESALRDIGWSLDCESLERGLLARTRQLRSTSRFDAVILQRKLLPSWQLAILRRSARRLIFDFDDAVFFRDSHDRRGIHSPRRARRFARVARAADAILAGNGFLTERAQRAGARPETLWTIPTCVDPSLYPAKTKREADPERPPDLVWIGSSSTLKGLEARRSLWERLGLEVPGLRLRVICDRFPDFDRIQTIPVVWSEPTEGLELARGDVGVSLLPDDDWSRGKCGLKVLQYQAAGLPVIANPVGATLDMVKPGETGILATTDDEWVEAVRALCNPSRRAEMGANGRRQVEAEYSVNAWASTFASVISGTALREPSESAPRPISVSARRPTLAQVGSASK